MRQLPTPATVAEQYLAAVLEELRVIRVLLEDRLPGLVADQVDAALGDVADGVHYAAPHEPAAPQQPTKRTRTRTREGAGRG